MLDTNQETKRDPVLLVRFALTEFRRQLLWAREQVDLTEGGSDGRNIKAMCQALQNRIEKLEARVVMRASELIDDSGRIAAERPGVHRSPTADRHAADEIRAAAEEWSIMTNDLLSQMDASPYTENLSVICMVAGVGICQAAELVHEAVFTDLFGRVPS